MTEGVAELGRLVPLAEGNVREFASAILTFSIADCSSEGLPSPTCGDLGSTVLLDGRFGVPCEGFSGTLVEDWWSLGSELIDLLTTDSPMLELCEADFTEPLSG